MFDMENICKVKSSFARLPRGHIEHLEFPIVPNNGRWLIPVYHGPGLVPMMTKIRQHLEYTLGLNTAADRYKMLKKMVESWQAK